MSHCLSDSSRVDRLSVVVCGFFVFCNVARPLVRVFVGVSLLSVLAFLCFFFLMRGGFEFFVSLVGENVLFDLKINLEMFL